MRLLFVLHYPPPIHGAAVIGGYIKKSRKVNGTFDSRFINLGTSASVEDIGRNSFRKLFRYFFLLWQVKKQLLFFRPDICYITPTAAGAGFYKDLPLIALVKLFRVKTVFHYHNKGVSNRQNRYFDNLVYKFAFRKTSVILLSKYLYPDIQKYVPENRVFYCPNGIPDQEDKRQKEKDKSTDSVPQILFLSHLIKSKGVLVLIDACTLLKEKDLAFHCTIAGGDAEMTQSEIERIVQQKNLHQNISVVGPKHGNEKKDLLSQSDIFVLPTFFPKECMPLVLIEAMQFAMPVVSTFEAAIPDIVDNGVTGYLVPQKDAEALADKLEILIQDSTLRLKMGAAGRTKYEREFTLERFEKRLAEILTDIGKS